MASFGKSHDLKTKTREAQPGSFHLSSMGQRPKGRAHSDAKTDLWVCCALRYLYKVMTESVFVMSYDSFSNNINFNKSIPQFLRFQIYPLWRGFSKSSIFSDGKPPCIVVGGPIWRKEVVFSKLIYPCGRSLNVDLNTY